MQRLHHTTVGQGRTDSTRKQERSERGQTAQVVQQDQLGSAAEYPATRKWIRLTPTPSVTQQRVAHTWTTAGPSVQRVPNLQCIAEDIR